MKNLIEIKYSFDKVTTNINNDISDKFQKEKILKNMKKIESIIYIIILIYLCILAWASVFIWSNLYTAVLFTICVLIWLNVNLNEKE